jgi:sigma-B regulation protein RsbU (phosphoserine phosphatase)
LQEPLLLRSFLDTFAESACLLGETADVQGMNAAAERLLGYNEDELLGGPFHPNREIMRDGDVSGNGVATAVDWRSIRPMNSKFRRKNGSLIDVVYTLHPLARDDVGSILLTFREREREPVEAIALKDIEAKLAAVFDTMPDGLIIIDEDGLIGFFSSGAERLFGYRRSDALGKNVAMLMPSPYREAHDGFLAAYRATGVKKIIGIGREVIGRREDGATFPMYLSIGEMWLEGRRYFVGVTHDLTKLKRAEEQLLILSSAVDQSPAAMLIATLDGRIQYVNQSFTQLTGFAKDELVGQNPRLLQSGRTAPEQYQRLWETLRDGREWRGEIQNRKKNGELYWAQETITPLRDTKGKITRYLAIQQDITEQNRAKEALAESEKRFRQVAKMTGEWLWEQDPQGCYIYSSGAVREILGFAPEEILGKTYLELLTAESRELWTTTVSSAPADAFQPFHHLINQYRHKDGREIYTESTGAPLFDEQGQLVKWRGVDHDITVRKIFEDALRVRNRAIEAAHIGIVITDAQARGNPNIYVNPALSRITGYSHEELLGQNMRLLQGPDTDPAALEQIRQALENGESCEIVLKNYRKSGAPFWNELLISPVFDDKGKVTNYIGIQTDVTERRRAEQSRQELEIARNIQLSLLPDAPMNLPTAELAGVCVAASLVGGDYFDFFPAPNSVDIVIADVSGHNVGAALLMIEVRSTLRAASRGVAEAPMGPATILRDLNELLFDDLNRAELFITMFYFKYFPDSRILKYANAGHNWALLLRREEATCTPLDAGGLVLGVWREVEFEERSVSLAIGDKLLLYTDGITEAQNEEGTFFGMDRLCGLFAAYREMSPEATIGKLLADLRAFCGEAPLLDDISMVVLRVR